MSQFNTLRVFNRLALPPYNMDDIDARLDRSERAADEMEAQGWHESAELVRETAKDIRQLHEMFRPR